MNIFKKISSLKSARLESNKMVLESLDNISKYLNFIENNYIDTGNFIDIFKNFDLGYIALFPGVFNQFIGKNSVVYVDIFLEESDDYYGKQKLRSDEISYKTIVKMSPPQSLVYKIPDFYELHLLEIKEEDRKKFDSAIQAVKNKAFNDRDTGFFTTMMLVFKIYLESFYNKEPYAYQRENLKRIYDTIKSCADAIDKINKNKIK